MQKRAAQLMGVE